MADADSAQTPDTADAPADKGELKDTFSGANNGETTPDANAPTGDTPESEAPDKSKKGVTPKFAKKAAPPKRPPAERPLTDVEIQTGRRFVYDTDGKVIGRAIFSTPQMPIGDAFSKLLFALGTLFSGDDLASDIIEMLYPSPPKHLDYNDRLAETPDKTKPEAGKAEPEREQASPPSPQETNAEKKQALREVIETPDHPDRQLTPQDFVSKYIGDQDRIKALAPQINALMDLVLAKESNGGDADIVYNYMGGAGLHPGEKTRGGLYVGIMLDKNGNQTFDESAAVTRRKFSESPLNQVIAWQDQYKDEQRAYYREHNIRGPDGEYKLPSSALGAFQFTGNTLEDMRDNGDIDGTRVFDLEAQRELGAKRLMWRIENALKGAGTIEEAQSNLKEQFRAEWEGLKKEDIQAALSQIAGEMANKLPPPQQEVPPPSPGQ